MSNVPIYILAGQSNAQPPAIVNAFRDTLDSFGEPYVFIHEAVGGTAMYRNDVRRGDWNVRSDGELKDNLFDAVRDAIASIEADGNTASVEGFAWVQGEADAARKGAANAYERHLGEFFGAFERAFGEDIPIVIAELRSTQADIYPFHETVRAAQHSFADANDNVTLLETDSFSLTSDEVHYTIEAYMGLGAALAGAFEAPPAPPAPPAPQPETIRGSADDDVLGGTSGDDQILGLSGDDRLSGQNGDDRLFGQDGDDIIAGGKGNDLISGGSGRDVMSGDQGADTFLLTAADGANQRDVIRDFQDGVDRLMLRDLDVVDIAGASSGTRITFDNGSSLVLQGVNAADVDEDDFVLRGSSDFLVG